MFIYVITSGKNAGKARIFDNSNVQFPSISCLEKFYIFVTLKMNKMVLSSLGLMKLEHTQAKMGFLSGHLQLISQH